MAPHRRDRPEAAARLRTDAEALPLLMEAMQAATEFDAQACRDALHRADAALTPRRPGAPHKSRRDIEAALAAAAAGDFWTAHRLAWSATTGLTWAFPPDISVCPQMPTDGAATAVACVCGAQLHAAARFCASCGTPRPAAG